jgi:hypothetical protein
VEGRCESRLEDGRIRLLVRGNRLKVGVADEIVTTFWAFDDRESGAASGGESVDDDIFDPGGVFTREAMITEPIAGTVPRAVGVRRRVAWVELFHLGTR